MIKERAQSLSLPFLSRKEQKVSDQILSEIVRKTGVQGQVGLTKYAIRIGLIDLYLWDQVLLSS